MEMDLRVTLVRKEPLVHKELQERRDQQALKAHRGTSVPRVQQVPKEILELKGQLVPKVLQALLDLRAHKEMPAHKVLLELKDYREM